MVSGGEQCDGVDLGGSTCADLGYESENRLVIHNLRESGAAEVQETLVSRLGNLRGVKAVSRSSEVPTRGNENNTAFMVKGKEHETGPQVINYISADYDFFDIYGIEPLTGRVFSRDFGADVARLSAPDAEINGSMVINEAAVSQLGFADAESALGQIISTDNFSQPTSFQVVGVIPNINNRSARYPAFSVIYWLRENRYSELTVHYGEDDPRELVSEIEAIWSELIPSVPFSHEIMEQMVRSLYLDDERQVTTISVFALLAIFISGLGLYAMASITVVKRTREIGLRKVMGARVREIIQLLLWQFSKPVVLANFLAWPVAWYFLDQWLSGFHYRISLSPVFFLLAGLVALLIAWVTVVGHAWRVARSNPISALRYE